MHNRRWHWCVAAALSGLCVAAAPLAAQDRMPRIAPDKLTDAQKKAVDAFAEMRGYQLGGPFVPLLRSPELMVRVQAVGAYLRFKSSLDKRINELVTIIAARAWTQQYEWNAHYKNALKEGLKREIADAIGDGRYPAGMAEDEEIAYALATEILRHKRVSDATYQRAVGKFGEQGVVDMLGLVGYYSMLATVMNATRTAMPAGIAPPLKAFPE
jgi:4-carboxymuconolactone decarboxylase